MLDFRSVECTLRAGKPWIYKLTADAIIIWQQFTVGRKREKKVKI
jgi:hypothetical protein